MSTLKYRPDIDGLRGLSVLAVVLYHLDFGLGGGYVGVDVFFVISGFLITGIILKELDRGDFSMTRFWARRIRRIVPAATATVAATLLAGYFLLSAKAYESLAESAIYQSLMAGNIYFWISGGYFTTAAEFKPLLHTWSLAVEEQFYLFLPPLMVILWRIKRSWLFPSLLGVFILSLLASCYALPKIPSATFFLLPLRAWELLAGSLLAFVARNPKRQARLTNTLSIIGLMLIVLPMVIYTHETRFPGWNAIPPVLGSALFIYANTQQQSAIGKIIGSAPLVFVGLMSYSLYLWHWPVFVFSNHMLIEQTLATKLIILTLSLALGYLSWRFVETPFRSQKCLLRNRSALYFGAITALLILGLSTSILIKFASHQRFSEGTAQLLEDIDWTGEIPDSKHGSPRIVGNIAQGGSPDFILWGDSYGMAVSQLITDIAEEHNLLGELYVESAKPPLIGCWPQQFNDGRSADFLAKHEMIFKRILESDTKNVILVAHWSLYINGRSPQEIIDSQRDEERTLVTRHPTERATPASASQVLLDSLNEMISSFAAHGIHLWIIEDTPSTYSNNTAINTYLRNRFPHFNELQQFTTSIDEYTLAKRDSHLIFSSIENDLVTIIDPTEFFFKESKPLKIHDQRAYYRDSGHLTRAGAEHYMREIFENILVPQKN